ncbi:hypothetical protein PENSPDRAFT_683959 [Peniophora sp. CONT]|nr:hypothetical protein PENSPDRAFT_683959 [Peniophora sp. CONT]
MALLQAGHLPHIWKRLRDATSTMSVMNAALTHLHGNYSNLRREQFIIGVDATSALWYCINNMYGIDVLYDRLCTLLRLPVTVIFYFDSDSPPPCSRRDIDNFPDWADNTTQAFIEFIEAFGFSWYRCMGEAAADLARLQLRGKVDVIMSDDIYPLVFGAGSFCSWPKATHGDETAVDLYMAVDLPLSREDLILVLILSGGKHSQDIGIGGVRVALRLCAYGLAHTLRVLALRADGMAAIPLAHACADWRAALLDALTELKVSDRMLARVPQHFPSPKVLELVATYWRSGGDWITPVPYFRGSTMPNVAVVFQLLRHHVYRMQLGVHRVRIIAQRMRQDFWLGVVMQYILLDPDSPRRLRSRVAGIAMPPLLDVVDVVMEDATHNEVIIPNRWLGGARACATRVVVAPLLAAIAAESGHDVDSISVGIEPEISLDVPFLIANRVLLAVWINHLGASPEL